MLIYLCEKQSAHVGFCFVLFFSRKPLIFEIRYEIKGIWMLFLAALFSLLLSQRLHDVRCQQDSRSRATEAGLESQGQPPSTRRSCHLLSVTARQPSEHGLALPAICAPAGRSRPHDPGMTEVLVASRWTSTTTTIFNFGLLDGKIFHVCTA